MFKQCCKGTNKHQLARNKSGWQLPDCFRAPRQKTDGRLPAGMPATELVWGWWELQGPVSLSSCYFSTWYSAEGLEEATGWVSRDVVILAHAGVHSPAAVLSSSILLQG